MFVTFATVFCVVVLAEKCCCWRNTETYHKMTRNVFVYTLWFFCKIRCPQIEPPRGTYICATKNKTDFFQTWQLRSWRERKKNWTDRDWELSVSGGIWKAIAVSAAIAAAFWLIGVCPRRWLFSVAAIYTVVTAKTASPVPSTVAAAIAAYVSAAVTDASMFSPPLSLFPSAPLLLFQPPPRHWFCFQHHCWRSFHHHHGSYHWQKGLLGWRSFGISGGWRAEAADINTMVKPVEEQEVYVRKYVFLLDQILFNRQIKLERLVANWCICLPFVLFATKNLENKDNT